MHDRQRHHLCSGRGYPPAPRRRDATLEGRAAVSNSPSRPGGTRGVFAALRLCTLWADEIRRGYVVVFRVPIRRAGEGESPKLRPCVVLDVAAWVGGKGLTLAYGASLPDRQNRGSEIPVTYPDDIRAAGLRRATRFIGARLISVAPGNAGFDVGGPAASPVIGRLSPNRMQRLDRVRVGLHAENDIATERRRRRVGLSGGRRRREARRPRARARRAGVAFWDLGAAPDRDLPGSRFG